ISMSTLNLGPRFDWQTGDEDHTIFRAPLPVSLRSLDPAGRVGLRVRRSGEVGLQYSTKVRLPLGATQHLAANIAALETSQNPTSQNAFVGKSCTFLIPGTSYQLRRLGKTCPYSLSSAIRA